MVCLQFISGSSVPPALESTPSIQSDRRIRDTESIQSLNNPPASPSLRFQRVSDQLHRLNLQHPPSLSSRRHAAEEPVLSRLSSNRSSRTAMPPRPYTSREQPNSVVSRERLNLHHSTSSSRGGRAQGHRLAADETHLSRLPSNRSSRAAMPPLHHSSLQHLNSGLSLSRFSVSATSLGMVTGLSPRLRIQDRRLPPIYDRSDQSSLERCSMQRSVNPKLSRGRERPRDHATARHTEAEGSSSTRRFRRLGPGLSRGMALRRGSKRAGTSPRYPSSDSNTIRSRVRRQRERNLLGAPQAASTPRMRRVDDDAVSSVGWSSSRPRRVLRRVDSGSTCNISSSSGFAPSSSGSASSSYYSPAPRRGRARPVYVSEATESSKSRDRRRRRERKERRDGRLRRLTKIAMIFQHHHVHHRRQRGQEAPPPESDRCALHRDPPRSDRGTLERKSPWKHLGGMFRRRTKGRDKKTASQTTVRVPAKKRGGNVLFSVMRHLHAKKRKAPAMASVKMRKMVQVKKKHWWQPQKKRGAKQRHRLGHGKTL
jgi:hypothetical protein